MIFLSVFIINTIMKEQIQNKIMHLQKVLEDCSTIIKVCNDDIEKKKLVPSDLQQAQLDSIAAIGRNTILEIERLNKLLKP